MDAFRGRYRVFNRTKELLVGIFPGCPSLRISPTKFILIFTPLPLGFQEASVGEFTHLIRMSSFFEVKKSVEDLNFEDKKAWRIAGRGNEGNERLEVISEEVTQF